MAAQYSLPAIYHFREFAQAGGLMSYGVYIPDIYWHVGIYTGRILKGDKAADLPVVQPTKFELVINLRTAKSLGVKISDNLLSLADEAHLTHGQELCLMKCDTRRPPERCRWKGFRHVPPVAWTKCYISLASRWKGAAAIFFVAAHESPVVQVFGCRQR